MHGNAHGVSFTQEKLVEFMNYADSKLDYNNLEPEYLVDFVFEAGELSYDKIMEIASLKNYWGKGMDEPLIAMKNIKIAVEDKTLMSPDKNPTLKFNISGISCIKFKSSQAEFDSIAPNQYTATLINAVGKCAINEWQGNVSPQILFEDYEALAPIMNF